MKTTIKWQITNNAIDIIEYWFRMKQLLRLLGILDTKEENTRLSYFDSFGRAAKKHTGKVHPHYMSGEVVDPHYE